jgi:hypothetical protein
MTAPTEYDDEAKLRRFIRAKPHHTGHHLSPKQLKDDTAAPWWFVDESAVERYEEAHHRLFCRACAAPVPNKVGHTYTPLLVDYQKNPLTDPPVLAATHCPNCGVGEMYPIEKLTWDLNDIAVSALVAPRSPDAEWAQQYAQQRAVHRQNQLGGQNQAMYGSQAQYQPQPLQAAGMQGAQNAAMGIAAGPPIMARGAIKQLFGSKP